MHIPFCRQACHYCDFHFSTQQKFREEMVAAMAAELALQRHYLDGEPVETIYLGGDTPSLLTDPELGTLLKAARENFTLQLREVTLEANPEDVTPEKLTFWKSEGINRLSMGIQTFDDGLLQQLNRSHSAARARQAVAAAQVAGFENISVDLMYALPGQSAGRLAADVEQAVALQPRHISIYGLTIEPRTAFGMWVSQGRLKPLAEEDQAAHFSYLLDTLPAAGYAQYEISNFALPGFEAVHNTRYWQQRKYLGIGPSAHSFNLLTRQFNVAHNARYVQNLRHGQVPATVEHLTHAQQFNEYVLTSLRTRWGCSVPYVSERFQLNLLSHSRVQHYLLAGYLALLNEHLVLTRTGKLVADAIAGDLFLDE